MSIKEMCSANHLFPVLVASCMLAAASAVAQTPVNEAQAVQENSDSVAAATARSVHEPVPTGQSVGLVLSGGGAKGIAEIGAIQALEDNEIPIDYIAGTSMGAIVGGLYACGYTPAEMMEMLASKGFSYWSSGTIDPSLTYYFVKPQQTPAFANVSVKIGRDSTDTTPGILPASLISPLPMNFAFMDLFAAYTAQCGGDFDNLFVPFRCVTSDIMAKKKIVCRSGHVSDAIRASMSFPCVFAPIKMDGVYVYDGGLYDNFPVDVMREDFAPDILIGVDVHASTEGPAPHNIITTIENMGTVAQDYNVPEDEGIHVRINVSNFGLLDWGKARELYDIGYRKTMSMMDTIKARVTSRETAASRALRRSVFKSQSPYVRFDSVSVKGGSPSQNEYIEHLFKPEHTDTFGIESARLAYYRALSTDRLHNLMPHAEYQKSNGLFTLDLDADVKNAFSVGVGGYLTSSSNSYIFASANVSSMAYRSSEATLMAWLGQSYIAAQFDGRIYTNRKNPSAFGMEAVYSRQKYYENDKLFYDDSSPAFITKYNGFARLYYGWALGSKGMIRVGAGGGQDRRSFYSTDEGNFRESGKVTTHFNLGQGEMRLDFNGLNNQSYPSEGYRARVNAMYVIGKYHYLESPRQAGEEKRLNDNAHWFQAEFEGEKYIVAGSRFSLGLTANVLYSNRKLLNTYYASIVNAPAYAPTDATRNVFNQRFRANSYAAIGIVPIWTPLKNGQVRLSANCYMPFRRIEPAADGIGAVYGKWFRHPEFIAQLDVLYNLPFASVSAYVNYLSHPARNWNVGMTFGLYFTADKFLR